MIAVVLAAATLTASSCSLTPDPVSAGSPSPTATSATPTPTSAPALSALTSGEIIESLPPLARTEDLLGAAVFARFYLDLSTRIFESDRDAVLFAHLSHPQCGTCVESLDTSNSARHTDATVEGGTYAWGDVYANPMGGQDDDGLWWVEEKVELTDMYTYSPEGVELDMQPGGQAIVISVVEFDDGYWQVHDVAVRLDDEQP
ncbi:hypothetical protein [Demequina muriae]|uniref:Lipoprotein n=1 Tax=Demequina muriae TaxID=3051664 RepID=A0ABT8GEN8_9MICO|nr:hypothetical protein [Demequina sp. EGI L300058]MDN4479734.1 hypothetical protein [Demequina sp. EGI L300058]